MTVLPGAPGLDELRRDPDRRDPVLYSVADELGPAVALDHTWNAANLHQLLQNADHVVGVQEPSCLDPGRFPREHLDDHRERNSSSVRRLVRHEVVVPDVIRVQRSVDGRRAFAGPTPSSSLSSYMEALPVPEQSKPVAADRRAFGLQDPMDLAVAPQRIALSELMDVTNESNILDPA